MNWNIRLLIETNLAQDTDEDMEARADEFDELHDKISELFEQLDGFVPKGWTVEVE